MSSLQANYILSKTTIVIQNLIPSIVEKDCNTIMAMCHLVVAQHYYMQTMAFRHSPSLGCSLEQK